MNSRKNVSFLYSLFFSLFFLLPFTPSSQNEDSIAKNISSQTADSNRVKVINKFAKSYANDGNYTLALKYGLQAYELAKKIGYLRGQINASYNVGFTYYKKGNYPEAITYQLQSLKWSEKINDARLKSNANDELGNIYSSMNNFEKAIQYYTTSLELRKKSGNKEALAASYNNLGILYDEYMGEYSKALEYYNESLRINTEVNNRQEMAKNYANIGVIYNFLKNYSEALKYLQKSVEIDEKEGYSEGASAGYITLADIYYSLKKYRECGTYYQKGIDIAKLYGIKDYLKAGYLGRVVLDSTLGNYKEVFSSYKKYIAYRDSLDNEENNKKILENEYNYKLEKKEEAAKAEQDKRDVIAKEKSRRQNLLLLLIAIAGAGVSVVAGLIYRNLRENKKKNKIIEKQKAEVEHKNKEITDSINYAKRLQDAILPPPHFVKQYLPENFIYYRPKDIVAGDFYWMETIEEEGGSAIYIASADSTGHGVPGAMVSVVCSNALNRSLKEFNLRDTGPLLDKTRELVLETFSKSSSDVKDGMDISLLRIQYGKERAVKNIQWSGANNPLWYITGRTNEKSEVIEIKADKQPIGKTDNPKPFTSHKIEYMPRSVFYLFTDGYPDQFGGSKGKKFKYKQLEELLLANHSKSMPEQENILDATFQNWKTGYEQVDDVCVIGIKL